MESGPTCFGHAPGVEMPMAADTKDINKTPALELCKISKRFPGVRALKDVDMKLYKGEILGIAGENGAGKSTLIKVMGGVHQPDSGKILREGKPVKVPDTISGIDLGISIIYQELSLVPELSVAENLYLGAVPRLHGGFIDYETLYKNSREILHTLGLSINPKEKVGSLSISVQQLVEIGKALARNAEILVMDEPTSSLGREDAERLFDIMRKLRDRGCGIIFITHRLNELFSVADRITVLRDGEAVDSRETALWDMDELIFAMVNRRIDQFYPKRDLAIGEEILSVEGLYNGLVSNVSFKVRAGEILGIAGLVGSGRSELIKTLYGVYPIRGGSLKVRGKSCRLSSPTDAIRHGLALVPENRKVEGLILNDSIKENLVLSVLRRLTDFLFVKNRSINHVSKEAVKNFDIKTPSIAQRVVKLSGGNQQKVVFARSAETLPSVLLLDEPTRGVDVGSKIEIYNKIMDFAEAGAAIVMVSSDLPEVLGLADRVIVMKDGKMTAELNVSEADAQIIMDKATGGA